MTFKSDLEIVSGIAFDPPKKDEAFERMRAALQAVSEQYPLSGDSGDTIIPGFIMDQVREAIP